MKLSSLIARAESGIARAAKHVALASKDFAKEVRVEWQAIKIADGEAARLKLNEAFIPGGPTSESEQQASIEAAEISERADAILAHRRRNADAEAEADIRKRVSKAVKSGIIPIDGPMLRRMDDLLKEHGL